MIPALLAVVAGFWILHVMPVPVDDPFARLIYLRTPNVWRFFVYTYVPMCFTTPWILFSFAQTVVFTQFKPKARAAKYNPLPPYIAVSARKTPLVVVGESHHPTRPERTTDPQWFVLPEKALYTGVACFGAVGSGKTTAFIRPLATQLFAYAANDPARHIGGIVLEVKGDFCAQVKGELVKVGRGDDVIELALGSRWRYNPLLNPDLDEDATAYAITQLIANIYGKGKDPFWPMASTNCMKFCILLHRLVYDYVTLLDIYRTVIDPGLLARKIEDGNRRYAVTSVVTIQAKDHALHADKLDGLDLTQDGQDVWHGPATAETMAAIKKGHVPHHVDLRATSTPGIDPEKQDQFVAVRRWFENDWSAISGNLRTAVVEGISVFLSLFDTNTAVKKIFCPPKEAYDPKANPREEGYPLGQPFPDFADLIESGKVVTLNFPVALNPVVARTIGVLMKLDYQRAMLLRIPQMAEHPERHFRPSLFVADEYQQFVTIGEGATGDQNFFALSRQARCIGLVATQSVISLKSALGDDDGYKTLLQTLRTKIFLNTADDVTAEYACRLAGREDQVQFSYNITESGQDARISALTGRHVAEKSSVSASKSISLRERDRFPQKAFYSLKNAQAIIIAFDGVNPVPPCYVYLKPWYLPIQESWWDQYERGAFN
jgi:hypothetical protein